MTRARRAASARPRRDRSRRSSSVRCSAVSMSVVDGMRHRTLYKPSVQGTSLAGQATSLRSAGASPAAELGSPGFRALYDIELSSGIEERQPHVNIREECRADAGTIPRSEYTRYATAWI